LGHGPICAGRSGSGDMAVLAQLTQRCFRVSAYGSAQLTVFPDLSVLLHHFERAGPRVDKALGNKEFDDILERWSEPPATDREVKVTQRTMRAFAARIPGPVRELVEVRALTIDLNVRRWILVTWFPLIVPVDDHALKPILRIESVLGLHDS